MKKTRDHHHHRQAATGSVKLKRNFRRSSFSLKSGKTIFTHMIWVHILILFIILVLPQLNQSTSNINSVWLAKDDTSASSSVVQYDGDNQRQSPASHQIKATHRDDEIITEEGSGQNNRQLVDRSGDWVPATKAHPISQSTPMQLAASSLQPSIVAIDQDGGGGDSSASRLDQIATLHGSNSRRRILTEPPPTPPRGPLNGTLTRYNNEAATSLDHLWRSNETNSQVQFDEEHNQNINQSNRNATSESQLNNHHTKESSATETSTPTANDGSAASDNYEPQRLQHNSSQTSNHEIPAAVDELTYLVNELNNSSFGLTYPQVTNHIFVGNNSSSSMDRNKKLADEQTKSNVYGVRDQIHNHQPPQSLSDKWNENYYNNLLINDYNNLIRHKYDLSASGNMETNGISQNHNQNNYHIYQNRVRHINPLAHRNPMISPRSTLAYGNEALEDVGNSNVDLDADVLRTTQPALKWPSSRVGGQQIQYGFVPQTNAPTATTIGQLPPGVSFIGLAHNNAAEQSKHQTTPMPYYPLPVGSSQNLNRNSYFNRNIMSTGSTQRPVNQPVRRSNNLNGLNYRQLLEASAITSQQQQQQQQMRRQILQQRATAASGMVAPSFLRNYLRPTTTTTTTPRPKRLRIFGGLGSKLVGSGSRVYGPQLSSIEGSFYDGLPRHQAANFYYQLPQQQQQQYQRLLIQSPTVAPAPSSYHQVASQFYGPPFSPLYSATRPRHAASLSSSHLSDPHLASGSRPVGTTMTNSQQQQQNFIPVVAVEVTKTSPAPQPMISQYSHQGDQESGTSVETSDPGSEIEDYLASKTGQRNSDHHRSRSGSHMIRNRQGSVGAGDNKHQVFDDYGNMAAGSALNRDRNHLQSMGSYLPINSESTNGNHEHVTTVKSAVFGYLPHQAEAPLVQAMSLLPQLSPAAALNSAASARLPSASDLYPHYQQTEGQQSLDQQQQQPQQSFNGVDEPPSLALQLQANNFVQNDIVHPFSGSTGGSVDQTTSTGRHYNHVVNHHHYTVPSPSNIRVDHRVKPIDVYPMNQATPYHEYSLFNGQQQAQQSQPQVVHQHQQLNPFMNPQLYASASEMNPLLPQILLAAPEAHPFNNLYDYQLSQQQQQQQQQQHHQQPQQHHDSQTGNSDSNEADESSERPLSQFGSSGSSALNNKGNKKRSSEFFANAGQLLLSALPLLLAPTLGLMFASSPNPVARFHGANALNTANGASALSQTGSPLPGHYINSLDSGQVLNASPAPQMFTPNPPTLFNSMASHLTPSRATTSTTTTTSTTMRPSSDYNGGHEMDRGNSSVVYPKLFYDTNPMPLRPPGYNSSGSRHHSSSSHSSSSNHSAGSTTQRPQPITLIMTTLSPPPFASSNDTNESAVNRNGSSAEFITSNQTILLVATPNEEDLPQDRSNSSFGLMTARNLPKTSTSSPVDSGGNRRVHYHDLGYEGVDFDAQFATLIRKSNSNFSSNSSPTTRIPTLLLLDNLGGQPLTTPTPIYLRNHHNRDKNRYQYSDVSPLVQTDSQQSGNTSVTKPSNTSQTVSFNVNDVSTKLYPVATWPPLRRRTVSLVTSSGNRTLMDSSEKYKIHPIGSEMMNSGNNNNNNNSNNPPPTIMSSSHRATGRRRRRRNETSTSAVYFDDFDDENDGIVDGGVSLNAGGALMSSASSPSGSFLVALAPKSLTDSNATTSGTSGKSAKSTSTKSAAPFMGPDEVALISLAGGWHSVRSKRSVNVTDAEVVASADIKPPIKRIRIVKRIRRKQLIAGHEQQDLMAASGSQLNVSQAPTSEPLRGDASKNKHIITAMTVSSSNGNDDEEDDRIEGVTESEADGEAGDPNNNNTISSLGVERQQMIEKKMLLDRIASGEPRPLPEESEHSERFSLGGGRGRIPSASQPIEVTATKIRLFANGSEQHERPARRNLVLTEDTRKALANFGSLLLKDTLEVPGKQSRSRQRVSRKHAVGGGLSRHRVGGLDRRQQLGDDPYYVNGNSLSSNPRNHRTSDGVNDFSRSAQDADGYQPPSYNYGTGNNSSNMNLYEYGTATERSFYRATPTPSPIDSANDSLAEYHRQRDSAARLNQDHQEDQRNRLSDPSDGSNSPAVDYPTPNNAYGKSSYSSFGTRYPSNESQSFAFQGNSSSAAPFDSHIELRRSSNSSSDREGHASSNYGNFTSTNRREPLTSAQSTGGYNEHYGPSYFNNYYTGPNRKDPRAPTASSYGADERNYPAHQQQQHQVAPTYSGRDYEPGTRYLPSSEPDHHHYHHHHSNYPMNNYAEPQRHSDHYNPNGYARPNRPYGSAQMPPSHPAQHYPPPSYPQPAPPHSDMRYSSAPSEHHDHRHNPDYYAPSGSNGYGTRHPQQPSQPLPPPPPPPHHGNQRYDHPTTYGGPTHQSESSSMYPLGAPADRSDSKTVNEYLKRVHFSDSDRDKLMASYLTCDGLLNDNDHCLERLSCEFSDPMNIEKANKLDRAVSSILLGHILINTYIPNQFKLRLKSASLFGYTQSGKCARFACNKLAKSAMNTNNNSDP